MGLVIAWVCDRCDEIVRPTSKKNKRPDGWTTVRSNRTGELTADDWLLCGPCHQAFINFMRPQTKEEKPFS